MDKPAMIGEVLNLSKKKGSTEHFNKLHDKDDKYLEKLIKAIKVLNALQGKSGR